MVELPLKDTDEGEAVTVTVGEGAPPTVTVALPLDVPPAPVQETVYVVLEARLPVGNEADVAVLLVLGDEHDVAFVDIHEMVELPLKDTDEGEAVTVTIGG
jgi:hypothetical protein